MLVAELITSSSKSLCTTAVPPSLSLSLSLNAHPNIAIVSIVDYLFRVLGVEYLHRYDLAHVKPDEHPTQSTSEHARPEPATPSLSYTKEAVARSAAMSEGLESTSAPAPVASPLDAHLDAMMGDAPVCDVCGHITVRNGACYKCLNCGNSMGCS